MELIDGNRIAADIIAELKAEVAALPGRKPCLALVRVGDDPASVSYVRKKEKTAAEIGIEGRVILPAATISQTELFALIDRLNADPAVDGILVQSPLPGHLDETAVFRRIAPAKDVDGLGTMNLGKVAQDDGTGFVSCTPAGDHGTAQPVRRHAGRPARRRAGPQPPGRQALRPAGPAKAGRRQRHRDGVPLADRRNLPALARQADVLIAAIGRPEFVTADMVKPGAVVIDVGINRVADPAKKSGYRLVGDVQFASVAPVAGKITPVPGGVGPMTVAMLMKNTLKAYRQQHPA